MKEYLKMSDVFDLPLSVSDSISLIEVDDFPVSEFDHDYHADYAAYAINSHDEIVSKLDCAESTIYEVERALSEMRRNGAFGLDDVISEVECCIKRISE